MRPDLIMVHIAGRADGQPAVDYTVNCEVGLPYLTGPADFRRPVNHVLPAWDLLTGMHAATAILAADRHRSRTGEGRSIRVALADVAVATMAHLGFVADVVVNGRGRLSGHPGHPGSRSGHRCRPLLGVAAAVDEGPYRPAFFQRKWTNTRPKFLESFSTRS